MTAYLIVNYDVEDPELYAEYQGEAGSALRVGDKCRLLAFDRATNQVEGDRGGRQTVVLAFDDMQTAEEVYGSGEYQALVPKRHRATSKHFAVLVDGFD